jgi:hypothetical protein
LQSTVDWFSLALHDHAIQRSVWHANSSASLARFAE